MHSYIYSVQHNVPSPFLSKCWHACTSRSASSTLRPSGMSFTRSERSAPFASITNSPLCQTQREHYEVPPQCITRAQQRASRASAKENKATRAVPKRVAGLLVEYAVGARDVLVAVGEQRNLHVSQTALIARRLRPIVGEFKVDAYTSTLNRTSTNG